MELVNARALVIGASSGIGRALCETLVSREVRVTATARDAARLGVLAELTGASTVTLDVTSDNDVRAVVAAADPEILVCNAGFGAEGVIEEVDEATLLHQYDVNVFGVWRAVRAALPAMRCRQAGAIVVVGSFGSRMPFPGIAAYRSSKAAVESLCWSLHLEASGFGVRVLHVQPGLTASDFDSNMTTGAAVDRQGPYREVYAQAAAAYPRMSPQALPAGVIAARVVDELARPTGPLNLAVGGDAERMIGWAAEGEDAFFAHIAEDLGYTWHREPGGRHAGPQS